MTKKRKKKLETSNKRKNTDYSEVVKKMKPVDQFEFNLSALLVGRSGTGKTTVACTFPKPILLLDFKEEGTDSVVNLGEDVMRVPIESWDEVEQLYWYLVSGEHKFKTVVWDTLTQAQDIALRKVLEDNNKSWGSLITRSDWGTCAGMLKMWFFNYRDLPLHFVITAQERVHDSDEGEDEDQLDPEVGPRVMPSVASTICPGVKMAGYTFIKEVTERKDGKLKKTPQFCMRVGPHPYYYTKIRRPKDQGFTPEYLVDPTYDSIVKVMKGEWKEESKKKRSRKKNPKK